MYWYKINIILSHSGFCLKCVLISREIHLLKKKTIICHLISLTPSKKFKTNPWNVLSEEAPQTDLLTRRWNRNTVIFQSTKLSK